MTVAFPRVMPSAGAEAQRFEPQRVDYLSPETGGRLGAVTAGFPLWSMSLSLAAMSVDVSDIWEAWLAAQRGAQRLFYGRPLKRPLPKRHMAGRPLNKQATSWSQSITSDGTPTLTLNGMLPGTLFTLGDYVDFRWDGWKRALVRAVDIGAANAGGVLSVAIEPAVPTLVPSGAIANLMNPECLMKVVSAESQMADTMLSGGFFYAQSGGRIAGIQEMIP